MSRVGFERVVKRYGAATALDGLDLDIVEGEFVSLLGPSGCGKTTALRLVAGFDRPTSGRILLDGADVSSVPSERRNVGMVFQDYALFPHMTVTENVAFGLRERRQRGPAVAARAAELLELVQLPGLGERYPGQLSGGQQQRVALARALAFGPRVLLMDEPLGALDLKLREAMQVEIQRIQRALGVTTLYVTHDQGEAIAMSSRIAVMNAGRIVQLGAPEEIYERPRTRFVARFVGRINLGVARILGGGGDRVRLEMAGTRIAALLTACPSGRPPAGAAVSVAVRPESLAIEPVGTAAPGRNAVPGRIAERVFAGNALKLFVDIGLEAPFLAELAPDTKLPPPDVPIQLAWAEERTTILVDD